MKNTKNNLIDCKSEEGITIGLIDSLITIATVLADRDLYDRRGLINEALQDLRSDNAMKKIMDIGELNDAKAYIVELKHQISTLAKISDTIINNQDKYNEANTK